jgi:hypothetical protein
MLTNCASGGRKLKNPSLGGSAKLGGVMSFFIPIS